MHRQHASVVLRVHTLQRFRVEGRRVRGKQMPRVARHVRHSAKEPFGIIRTGPLFWVTGKGCVLLISAFLHSSSASVLATHGAARTRTHDQVAETKCG